MRYEQYQFDGFDTLESRREIMALFVRMGHGLSFDDAAQSRATFLKSLLASVNGPFQNTVPQIKPCSAVEAYHLFNAITGCLNVPIKKAVDYLERHVRRQPCLMRSW